MRNLILLLPNPLPGDRAGFMGNPDIRTPRMGRLTQGPPRTDPEKSYLEDVTV